MKRTLIAAALATVLVASSVIVTTEEAEANPALILGIAAWKFVAIAATGIIAGALFARATQQAQAAPLNCGFIQHTRRNGTHYLTRAC